ncbi:MAG TPA: hypothetical protein VHS58_00970 [Acetobacteraceae bacterium]|jgi:hypothetical protein|nr:hypothetical protein [Acetobacteraceae bacterium]
MRGLDAKAGLTRDQVVECQIAPNRTADEFATAFDALVKEVVPAPRRRRRRLLCPRDDAFETVPLPDIVAKAAEKPEFVWVPPGAARLTA